jgi:glycosyltransferase involved in cell wall biosynthesis
MRVAYIGHAYHQKTGSTKFFIELLRQYATVDVLIGEQESGATWPWVADFDENRYDIIVVFQMHEALGLLSGRHPNVIFVPMYDAMLWAGNFYWKSSFEKAKIACFSWALRQQMMLRGAVHAGFQYFPDPSLYPVTQDFGTLRGFLWHRRREIPPTLAFNLTLGTQFDKFVIHDAPDPGHQSENPLIKPTNIRCLERTMWSEDGKGYETAQSEANVFFAPRPHEGIGMSVLGAMASGHCVVAPDAPTMNEYISNGTTGLLYNPHRPSPPDFTEARAIGARARESIQRGHERWLTSIPVLMEFIATPTAVLRGGARPLISVRNNYAPDPAPVPPGRKLVSVVTVCRDAEPVLEATMASVLGQTGCDFEYLVLDRGSTDRSTEIIRSHADRLAMWRSAPDNGPYETMNAALELIRGEWVLFMNAGDTFASEDALRRMFSRAPPDADIVFGHHVRRLLTGGDELRLAAGFETTWSRLRRGDLSHGWLSGLPAHPATAVRRQLLMRSPFDTSYKIAADHHLLFRARAAGTRFFNCDEVVAIHAEAGLSRAKLELCVEERLRIACLYGDADAAKRFFTRFVEKPAARGRISRVGGIALHVINILDRYSPALARTAERIARSAAVRNTVRRLLRRPPPTGFAPAPTGPRLTNGTNVA